jgi:hypothetical protein
VWERTRRTLRPLRNLAQVSKCDQGSLGVCQLLHHYINAVVGRHQADRGGKYQAIAAMQKLTEVLRTIAFEALPLCQAPE